MSGQMNASKEDRIIAAIFACSSEDCPRPFALYRHQDITGVSGTGSVAHGVQFADGQVVIRWHLQLGNVVIPKSVTPSRIEENIDVFGFELSEDELAALSALDRD